MPQTTERQVVLALPSMSPKLTYENLPPRLVWDLHASSISCVLYPGFPFNRSWFQSQCHNYSCSLIIRAWQTLAHHTQFWVIIQNTQVVTWETARQAYKNASVGFYFPFKLPIRCWLYLCKVSRCFFLIRESDVTNSWIQLPSPSTELWYRVQPGVPYYLTLLSRTSANFVYKVV